jgi:hypothetical protein
MQSIFIEAREWFDKVNGNSYFSGRVELDGELVAYLPFQYGYESAYRDAAFRALQDRELIPATIRNYWELKAAGYAVYSVKYQTTKRDAVRFGKTWQEVAA